MKSGVNKSREDRPMLLVTSWKKKRRDGVKGSFERVSVILGKRMVAFFFSHVPPHFSREETVGRRREGGVPFRLKGKGLDGILGAPAE